METWFIWHFGTAIAFYVLSLGLYFIGKTKDLKDTKLNFFLVGLAIAISSFWMLGLWCLIVVSLYWITVWAWDLRFRGKFKR